MEEKKEEEKVENYVKFGVNLTFRKPNWLRNLLYGHGFTITGHGLDSILGGYRLYFKIKENAHICPFCHEYPCDCEEEFEKYFQILQEQIKAEKNDTSTSPLSIRLSPPIVSKKRGNSGEIKVSRFEKEEDFPYRKRLKTKKGRVYVRKKTYDGKSLTLYLSRSHRDGNTEYFKGSIRFSYAPIQIKVGRYRHEKRRKSAKNFEAYKTYASWGDFCRALLAVKETEKE